MKIWTPRKTRKPKTSRILLLIVDSEGQEHVFLRMNLKLSVAGLIFTFAGLLFKLVGG